MTRLLVVAVAAVALGSTGLGCSGSSGAGDRPGDAIAPSMILSTTAFSLYKWVDATTELGDRTVTVSAFGSGVLPPPLASVRYDDTPGWISGVTVSGDAAPYTVTIQLSTAALDVGTHSATLTLACAGAPNGPRTVGITVRVVPAATLEVSPPEVGFAATTGAPAPASDLVTVRVSGYAAVVATTRVDFGAGPSGWLTATARDPRFTPFEVTLQPVTAGLAAGTYDATVVIELPGAINTPATVPVRLTVSDPVAGIIAVSPASLEFTAAEGTSAASQSVTVSEAASGALARPTTLVSYPAGPSAGWLSTKVTGSAPPYAIDVAPATSALVPGLYKAVVSVVSPGATNSPTTFPVVLKITRHVTISHLCTAWMADGATTTSPCTDVTVPSTSVTNTRIGTYSVTFTPDSAGVWSADVPSNAGMWLYFSRSGVTTQLYASAPPPSLAPVPSLDLGHDDAGRAGTVPWTSTIATFPLSGLQPWTPGADAVLLTSWDAGLLFAAEPALAAGATSFSARVDFAAMRLPLLAPGDDLSAMQVRSLPTPSGAATYLRTVAASAGSGVQMSVGTPATVPLAPLAAPPETPAVRVDWRHSQFEAGLASTEGATARAHVLSILAVPVPLDVPSPFRRGAATQLLDLVVDATTSVPDTDYGTLTYGRFLPARYREYRVAGYYATVPRAAPGATAMDFVEYVARYDEAQTAPAAVIPIVTAVRNPQIAGRDALQPQTGVGTYPLVSWTPPVMGAATSYRVVLYQLSSSGGATVATPVLERLSRGWSGESFSLVSGRTYVVGVQALSSAGDRQLDWAVWRDQVPLGASMVYTSTFSP